MVAHWIYFCFLLSSYASWLLLLMVLFPFLNTKIQGKKTWQRPFCCQLPSNSVPITYNIWKARMLSWMHSMLQIWLYQFNLKEVMAPLKWKTYLRFLNGAQQYARLQLLSNEGDVVFFSSTLTGGRCAIRLLLHVAIIVKSTGTGIYNNCPFIPKVVKKAREVHIIKPWRAGVDEPG